MVLAKVIMIGGLVHLGRRLEHKPLILSTLFQSALFTCWVTLFALGESTVRGLLHGKGVAGALEHLLSEGTHEFYAKCLVVFVAFIPFFAFKELGRVLGKGIIWDLFFRKGPGAAAHPGDLDRLKYGQPNLPPAPGSLPQTVREQ